MAALPALWLPILVSAVAVFLVSFVIHMVLPWHKHDYAKMANEDKVMAALRPFAIPPGDYMVPRASTGEEMKSAEFAEKLRQGPVLMMTVLPNGPWTMTQNLINWFLYCAVVGCFAAYVAGRALGVGADYLAVFRFAGTTAFIGYALALWQMSIWFKRAWVLTIKATIDGMVYALVTAGIFGWLWPR